MQSLRKLSKLAKHLGTIDRPTSSVNNLPGAIISRYVSQQNSGVLTEEEQSGHLRLSTSVKVTLKNYDQVVKTVDQGVCLDIPNDFDNVAPKNRKTSNFVDITDDDAIRKWNRMQLLTM